MDAATRQGVVTRRRAIRVQDAAARALSAYRVALDVVLAAALVGMVVATSLGVFYRYVLGHALVGPEEIATLLMVWVTFLGMASAVTRGQEIRLDFLVARLPAPLMIHVRVFERLCTVTVLAFLVAQGLKVAEAQARAFTPSLNLSMGYLFGALPVGAALMAVEELGRLVATWREHRGIAITVLVGAAVIAAAALAPWDSVDVPLGMLLFPMMLVLFLLGMPVSVALAGTAMLYLLIKSGPPFVTMPTVMTQALNSVPLLAVPFFLLAGELMNSSGITRRLVDFSRGLVGHIHGGLAHVNIITNLIMSGVSGSAVADAAATGTILIPAMERAGYRKSFAAAITAAAASVGPIIPPSIPFVLIGVYGNVSIGRLFLGGVIPGLILALFLMVTVYVIAQRRGYPRDARVGWGAMRASTIRVAPALAMPAIVIYGIVGGIVTPTEAGVVAVVYAFLVGVVYREITPQNLLSTLTNSGRTLGTVMSIVAAASLLGWTAAFERLPQTLSETLLAFAESPWLALVLLNVFLLVLGAVMDMFAVLIVVIPILFPVIAQLGIDPVHFGVVLTLNVMVGLISPPVGTSMYVVCAIAKITIGQFAREIVPYLLALVVLLAVVTFVPGLVLFLPNLVFR